MHVHAQNADRRSLIPRKLRLHDVRIPENRFHYIFASNFVKCGPIFKILSSADLTANFY